MTAVLGSVVDLAEMYDTCGCCVGAGVVIEPGAVESCSVCHGVGLTRLCLDCMGEGTQGTDNAACDGCDGAGEVA